MRLRLRGGVRTWLLALGCLVVGGCKQDGAYQLSWTFAPDEPVTALKCAQRGVFSVRVSAISADSVDTVAVPCAPGLLKRAIAPSTWSFEVRALDSDGKYRPDLLVGRLPGLMDPLTAKLAATEIADGQTAILAVQLNPLPECADGVDNNGDGRVDIDDPACAGKVDGAHEGTAAEAAK
jgi:hypothetical protein